MGYVNTIARFHCTKWKKQIETSARRSMEMTSCRASVPKRNVFIHEKSHSLFMSLWFKRTRYTLCNSNFVDSSLELYPYLWHRWLRFGILILFAHAMHCDLYKSKWLINSNWETRRTHAFFIDWSVSYPNCRRQRSCSTHFQTNIDVDPLTHRNGESPPMKSIWISFIYSFFLPPVN